MRKNIEDKTYNTQSINRIVFLIITAAIIIQGVIWLADTIMIFREDMDAVNQIQTDYIKAELKERVASVIDYSDYRSQETEAVLRESLESRTYEAYALMTNIYEQNKEDHSKEEITKMIKDALREIRFNDGRGYFFIDTLEGDVILYPVYPENEGKNLIDLQDDMGSYTLQDEIQLVNESGEGFIEGNWKNPNIGDDKTYRKITFVKAFEPYGWYLGCGDYVDEITKEIQAEVLAYVDSIQYGENNTQYVFLHDYDGIELANGVYPEYLGRNNYDLEDIHGAKVYQEQIKMSKENGGGYLVHYWPTIDGNDNYKKLTYVAPLAKWEWIIGTGVDVSALDDMIASKEVELRNFIIRRILIIVAVLGLLILVAMYYVNGFMGKVKKNFTIFRDNMISANKELKAIDVETLDYMDFSELAVVTNSMTERINHLLHYDELTGIYNRRYIMEIFNTLKKDAQMISIILMDIDLFKNINDNYGHEIGDQALAVIASILEDNTPKEGAVGRFGGEEFVMILKGVSLEETIKVAEKVRQSVASSSLKDIKGHITISGGIAHSKDYDIESLFKEADLKLYEAKALGRNRMES